MARLIDANEQFCLVASNNTDYVLAYADGIYTVTNNIGNVICEFMPEQPIVDAVPVVHGKWNGWTTSAFIGMDDTNEPKYADRQYFRCSQCDHGSAVKHKFCPNCGARMDLEDEAE